MADLNMKEIADTAAAFPSIPFPEMCPTTTAKRTRSISISKAEPGQR
jgi:hypothetical protein